MAAKKTFSEYLPSPVNPAAMFRSEPAAEEKRTAKKDAPINSAFPKTVYDGAEPIFSYETKSRRVQLLIQPSIYEEGKRRAAALGIRSFNDYITQLVQNDLENAKKGEDEE